MPRAPKVCGTVGCPNLTRGTYCDEHQRERGRGRGRTASAQRTGTRKFNQRIRPAVLRRDPVCKLRRPGCTQTSTEVDHIQPVYLGGSDDLTNARGVCRSCHLKHTGRQAAQARWVHTATGADSPAETQTPPRRPIRCATGDPYHLSAGGGEPVRRRRQSARDC